jgi:hypothetical protein
VRFPRFELDLRCRCRKDGDGEGDGDVDGDGERDEGRWRYLKEDGDIETMSPVLLGERGTNLGRL